VLARPTPEKLEKKEKGRGKGTGLSSKIEENWAEITK